MSAAGSGCRTGSLRRSVVGRVVQNEDPVVTSGLDDESRRAEGCGHGQAESVPEPVKVAWRWSTTPARSAPSKGLGDLFRQPADHDAASMPDEVYAFSTGGDLLESSLGKHFADTGQQPLA